MPLTLDDLIAKLQDVRAEIAACIGSDDRAGEAEVRLAVQPSWPFEHRLDGSGDLPVPFRIDDAGDPVAYLAEAGQVGYLPGDVAGALGWS